MVSLSLPSSPLPLPLLPSSARLSLLSSVKEVRAGGLRVLRYLLTSREAFIVMRKHCIDLLVVRSLDAPPNREIERLQAVRFVRQAMSLCPNAIPHSLVAPLVSIVMSTVEPQDNLTWSCMATLCELGERNDVLVQHLALYLEYKEWPNLAKSRPVESC